MPANTTHTIVRDRQPETIGLDDALLWRYHDLPKFLHLIQTGTLYFARLTDFEDPYEGYRPIMNYLGRRRNKEQQHTDTRRLNVVVNCWCWNESENAALWTIYGRASSGIAVLTSYRKLVSLLPSSVFLGFVHYLDYFDPTEYMDRLEQNLDDFEGIEGHLLRPVLYKRQEFCHEDEVRAFSTDYLLDQESRDGVNKTPKGWTIRIDPAQLIDMIYIQPFASPSLMENVQLLVAKYGYKTPIVPSTIDRDPW